jgi:hypothetical protein
MLENTLIKKLYTEKGFTLHRIADSLNRNHHLIRRRLVAMGIEITQKGRNRKPFTEAHRKKISDSRKLLKAKGWVPYNKGLKTADRKDGRILLLKNMKAHLKYEVSLEWLNQFENIEKLKCLNRSISRERDKTGFTTDTYKHFIEKFYGDKKFNELFDEWVITKDKWIKPSLDHIQAKAKKGSLLLDNLQFISWLENRAKIDISQVEWDKIKSNINYYL